MDKYTQEPWYWISAEHVATTQYRARVLCADGVAIGHNPLDRDLMATAPDMLKVLEKLIQFVECNQFGYEIIDHDHTCESQEFHGKCDCTGEPDEITEANKILAIAKGGAA